MRIRAFGAASLVAGSLLALGLPSNGWAQGIKGLTGTFSGAAEIGARAFTAEPTAQEKGKFEEYKDLRAGAVLARLLLNYTPRDSLGTYALSARNLFQRDQSMRLQASRPGLYDFDVRWDGIVHTFSTTARSPGEEFTRGYNTLPAVRPDSTAWRNAPYIGAIRSQWNPVRAVLAISPTPELDFKAEYSFIEKTGGRPMGLSFAGSGGPSREFVEPIDQVSNDIRLSQSYANDRVSITGSYAFSLFQNNSPFAVIDNPVTSTDQVPSSGTVPPGTSYAARSLIALAPDNTAHTGSVSGSLNLPRRTRLTGSVSYSLRKQNDAFFNQSTNAYLAGNPLLALQRGSLEGEAKTTAMNVGLISRPVKNLTLTGRVRVFDYSNQTPHFQLKAMAISDRSIALGDSLPFEPFPYTKTNTDLSGTYRLPAGLSLTAGYALENWKRDPELRNRGKTDEGTSRVSLYYAGNQWVTLRGSYTMASRRGNDYALGTAEFDNFRRFDISDRDRTRVNLGASVMPNDSLSVSFSYQSGNDRFPNSQYGITADDNQMFGTDVDWSPSSRLSLGVGFTTENSEYVMDSRYRTGAVGSPTYDNATYRWQSADKGKATTTYASFSAVLVPDKLDVGGNFAVYDSRFHLTTRNAATPTGGTAAQNTSATAEDWPEVRSKMQPISVFARWTYAANWAVTARYQIEKHDQSDFRFQAPSWTGLTGALPGAVFVGPTGYQQYGAYHFLGHNFLNYNASYVTLLVSYRPAALPFARGRSIF